MNQEPLYPALVFKRIYYRINGRIHYDVRQMYASPLCPDIEWVLVKKAVRDVFPAKLQFNYKPPAYSHVIYQFNDWLRTTFGESGPPDGTEVLMGSRW